jgi:hypothetical protein
MKLVKVVLEVFICVLIGKRIIRCKSSELINLADREQRLYVSKLNFEYLIKYRNLHIYMLMEYFKNGIYETRRMGLLI